MRRGILAVSYLVVMSYFIVNHRGSVNGQGPLKSVSTKLPYCPVDKKIRAFLKVIRSQMKSKTGRKPRVRRQTNNFPANCGHVALDTSETPMVIETEIFQCCETCKGNFNTCVSTAQNPSLVCPSKAHQCISQCICNGSGRSSLVTAQVNRGRPSPGKCTTKTVTRPGKSSCIQRSCIPV